MLSPAEQDSLSRVLAVLDQEQEACRGRPMEVLWERLGCALSCSYDADAAGAGDQSLAGQHATAV